MNHLIWIAALAVLLAAPATADDIYIPDNNTTGSVNVIPYGGVWPSTNTGGEWRYQWWIPAAAIGKAGTVKEIAVYPTYTGVFTATTAEYSMGHNTQTAPSTGFATNLPNPTVVYAPGPYTWSPTANTWSTLGMQSGFLYNGVDNLVVEVRLKGAKVTGASYIGCRYDSSAPNNPWRIYAIGAGAYTSLTGSLETRPNGLRIRLTMDLITIVGSGTTNPGGAVNFALSAAGDAGLPYQAATSLGTGPIPIGTRQLNLSADDLLVVSIFGYLPSVFVNYAGKLDAKGAGQATLNIPNVPAFVGIRLHTAFVTLDANAPQGIRSVSPTYSFTITK